MVPRTPAAPLPQPGPSQDRSPGSWPRSRSARAPRSGRRPPVATASACRGGAPAPGTGRARPDDPRTAAASPAAPHPTVRRRSAPRPARPAPAGYPRCRPRGAHSPADRPARPPTSPAVPALPRLPVRRPSAPAAPPAPPPVPPPHGRRTPCPPGLRRGAGRRSRALRSTLGSATARHRSGTAPAARPPRRSAPSEPPCRPGTGPAAGRPPGRTPSRGPAAAAREVPRNRPGTG